ncbi:MAG: hypothetical protein HQM09_23320 [Candidatus Riflebacteria bacterium]|nr:hypothetical protein [Candidatus Riflebacteria bacterium]
MEIKTVISGIKPLLQNNYFEYDFQQKKFFSVQDPMREALSRLIVDENNVICQPAKHIKACIADSADDFILSSRYTYKHIIKSSIEVVPSLIQHEFQDYSVDEQYVSINNTKILRKRPSLFPWRLIFNIKLYRNTINIDFLEEIIVNAGRFHGIGDYRPEFGLFKVDYFKVIEHTDSRLTP